jgi:hypothetical protein
MIRSVSQVSRRQFQKLQEDSAQLTTLQKSDPFFPYGLSCVASGCPPMLGQHDQTLFSVQEDSNFPLQTGIGKDSL